MNWRSVTPSNHPKFFVNGTELSTMLLPGLRSRYQICEIRCRGADGHPDRRYAVRDASTVTDAEVREGVRSKIVKWFDYEDEVWAWCYFGL